MPLALSFLSFPPVSLTESILFSPHFIYYCMPLPLYFIINYLNFSSSYPFYAVAFLLFFLQQTCLIIQYSKNTGILLVLETGSDWQLELQYFLIVLQFVVRDSQ